MYYTIFVYILAGLVVAAGGALSGYVCDRYIKNYLLGTLLSVLLGGICGGFMFPAIVYILGS